jgi:sugar/nucleoside kinase (ribokinase family)
LILKLGNRGILTTTSSDSKTLDDYFVMDSFVDNLVDPVGAGDALLAYATLVLAKTGNEILASIIGNLAAACECEKEGNEPIIPSDIIDKILSIERQVNLKVR